MNNKNSFQYLQKKGTKADWSIVTALVWDANSLEKENNTMLRQTFSKISSKKVCE